jgi:hypothetical protein
MTPSERAALYHVNPKNWEKHIMIQNGILSISLRFSFKMGKQDMSI